MNTIINRRMTCFVVLFISLFFLVTDAVASEAYTLDNEHSYVQWSIKHLGFSTQTGKWFAEGTLVLDKAKPENSKVDVTIDVANIVTGLAELDKHLKGKDFFNVEKYPKATFVSNKIVQTGDDAAMIYGKLTLHGVTKPIILTAVLNREGVNPITHKKTVGFTARGIVKRSDFGITTYIPVLGNDVLLDINVEATLANK